VLGPAQQLTDLGAQILPQLYERELEYLCTEEFALTAEDILWRRSKLGLHLLNTDIAPLQHWLEQRALAVQRRALTAGVV
jgi:glycerol-3-phosphate dehydrogenase